MTTDHELGASTTEHIMSELRQTRKLEQPKVEPQKIATENIKGEQPRQQETKNSEVHAAKPVGEGVAPQQGGGENTATRELNRNDAANTARVSASDHNNCPRDGLTAEAPTKGASGDAPASRGSAPEGTATAGKPKEGPAASKEGSSTPQEASRTKGAVAEGHAGGSLQTEGSPAKPTEGEQAEKGKFGALINDIESHDWVKELDGKVQIFYGGVYTDRKGQITEPAWQRADREKLDHERLITINDTKCGKEITASKESLTEAQSNELWSTASRKYAEAADANFSKGITPVGYVQWAGLEKDHLTAKRSDFEQVEWPRLRGLMTDEPVQRAKFEMWPDYYPKDKDGGPLPQ